MSREKKWNTINDLLDEIYKDSTLSTCYKDLTCIEHAPHIGYRSWIFKYKSVYVALFDAGNGYYTFQMPVSRLDVVIAKVIEWISGRSTRRRCNKSSIGCYYKAFYTEDK